MSHRSHRFSLIASGLLVAATAQAQPPPGPRAGAPAHPNAAGAPAQRGAQTPPPTATAASDLEPPMPEVDDPMLQEPPRAEHVVGSWQDALRMVRSQTTTLAIAAAQVEQASAQARLALASALPTLTGTANVQRHLLTGTGLRFGSEGIQEGTIPDPLTTWNAGLELRVPVFAPAAWATTSTARRAVRATAQNTKETQREVLGAVADSIVSVVTAERLAEVSRVSLRSALATLELNRRRARLGAATAVDVLRADQEVALARAQVVATEEALLKSREALGLALGSADAWSVAPNVSLDALATDARAICHPERTVDDRPDVRAARANLEVAEKRIQDVDWQFLPTVDFVSDLGYTSNDRFSANGKHVTWTIGGVLTWHLYDGGVRYAQRDQHRAEAHIAREQLTQTQRQARIQIAQAQRAVRVSDANLQVSSHAQQIAIESARLSRIAFVNGTGTSFDLVDSTKRLRDAEIDLAVKEFDVVRSRIAALLAVSTCDLGG